MQTNMKKWLAGVSTGAFAISMLGTWAPQADARMVFSTEEGSTNADSYTIDYDDSAGTGEVILRFGSTANKTISYDNDPSAGYFKINDDISFEGNKALNFELENNNGEIATCAMELWGRLYYDTSDEGTYVCTQSGWVDLSKMDGLTANDFLSSNGDDNYTGTGTLTFDSGTALTVSSGATLNAEDATVNMDGINNETFTLDEDGSGGDVSLVFGSSLGEAITWDESQNHFDFSDDVYINGDLTITGTFSGTLATDLVDADAIAANAVGASELADNAVDTNAIQNDAVTSAKIDNGTIVAEDIAGGTITANEIAGDTITAAEIAAEAITSSELANNAVDTAAVQDYAITTAKINTGAVTTDQIANGTITTEDIADGAITSDKIGTGAISVNNLADDSITADKIATGAITTDEILDETITQDDLADVNKSILYSPEFPNFTLYGDTTNNLGTLDSDRDVSAQKNYYSWTSRKTALNDYDILTQFQIPDDFQEWQTNALSLDYKTAEAGTADNNIQIYLLDTTGTSTYTGSTLASASWTTNNITSASLSSGTYTPGEYITVGIKLSSRRNDGSGAGDLRPAYVGELKFNYVGK